MTLGKIISQQSEQHLRKLALAKRVTLIGMAVSGSLSVAKLLVGWIGHSTAVFADGLENGETCLARG
jgi:divalent metal cation (Fe/Co/Zn/Cd) transporter